MTAFSPAGFQLLFRKFPRTTGLARDVAAIDRNLLRDEYAALVERAPRRADRCLAYYSDERDGTHSTSGRSGRNEEHLAVALWNLGGSWPRAAGRPFRLLDYQFPLKARFNDEGIGKVDLLAATESGRLVVIELKVAPKSENDRGDTPLDALVQGIRYAAIVEANLSGIARAAKSCFGVEIAEQRPIVQVLRPRRGGSIGSISKAGRAASPETGRRSFAASPEMSGLTSISPSSSWLSTTLPTSAPTPGNLH